MTSSMQGKGRAAPDSRPSVNLAHLTRLSVLIGDADAARSQEIAALVRELGVRHVVEASSLALLLRALKQRAFDVVLCAEPLGSEDGVAALRDAAPATRLVLMRAGAPVPGDLEALELPVTRPALEAVLQRVATPEGGLWCEVPALSLTDVLQMYHQARRTITVLLSGPIAGRVWLEEGEIVAAEGDGERGLAAVSYLLGAETGLLRTEPPKGPVARTISAPFQSVLLDAARTLDERRRDTRSSGYPAVNPASGVPSPSWPGAAEAEPPAPGRRAHSPLEHSPLERELGDSPFEHLPLEQPSSERAELDGPLVSPLDHPSSPVPPNAVPPSGVALPSMRHALTPPIESPPSIDGFYAERRERRQQAYLAALGVLLGLAVVGIAAWSLGNRASTSPRGASPAVNHAPRGAAAPRAPADTPSVASEAPSPAAGLSTSTSALTPSPPAAPPPPRAREARRLSAPRSSAAASREALAPRRAEAPAPAARNAFELAITSQPSRATVSEAGRVLGRTPLRLTISRRSVAARPREFVLRLAGHLPATITQGPSDTDVVTEVTLSPRAALAERIDAGTDDDALGPGDERSPQPSGQRRERGLRLRR